jgi:hypothetical protein
MFEPREIVRLCKAFVVLALLALTPDRRLGRRLSTFANGVLAMPLVNCGVLVVS